MFLDLTDNSASEEQIFFYLFRQSSESRKNTAERGNEFSSKFEECRKRKEKEKIRLGTA